MRAIPAIDLRAGACVQLVGGSYAEERIRLADPVAVAAGWRTLGFERLHVVDLDAATARGSNAALARRVIDAFGGAVQIGGGVRDEAAIAGWLAAGAESVVIGTRGIADPDWRARMCGNFPGRLVLAADTRDDRVLTHGWSRVTTQTPEQLAREVTPLPLAALLVTAVDREGRLTGADLTLYRRLRAATTLPLIASGGIATHEDLERLERSGVNAAVLGMALYTHTLDATRVAVEFAA